ncbi:MAG: sodium:calcium symporter [Cytophagales bacterium]|nr:MAG: sodium:calcium symporter [Cytophagales bacterium]
MSNNESWGSRVGLVLAMAGNAVGLGNFLRFPVQAVQNGGGAFIIPYIICFLVMGIPLLFIEWSMGRFGGKFNNHSTPFILDTMSKGRSFWKYFGVFGIFTNIAVAAYYCYIESWTMAYVYHSIVQTFAGKSQAEVAAFFGSYVDIYSSTTGIPFEAIVFYIFCLLLNTYILSRGLSGGVEAVAKIGMPLLIIFGVFLAFQGLTLGTSGAPAGCADCDSYLGLNFLWNPQFDSLANPKVWLAAAGQIFFTLSVGMGTIQCYAAYISSKDDIALNAMSAGWMNEFVEVVLGASIVIPISVGYLGLDWVLQNAGFSMAFQTMPFLFGKWGLLLGTVAGVMWFGLLFFAGITSSLAMGTPWMGFMQDEFKWSRSASAWTFGLITLIMGLPTVLFYNYGYFGEYDNWAGTVSLVVFALAETILFGWIFGMERGWAEINEGADMKIPIVYKFIIKYITPLLLLFVFVGSLVTPKNNDWLTALSGNWELDNSSIIGQIQNKGIVANRNYFANYYENEVAGKSQVMSVEKGNVVLGQTAKFYKNEKGKMQKYTEKAGNVTTVDSLLPVKTYTFDDSKKIVVKKGDSLAFKDKIAEGSFVNNIFFIDLARIMLLGLFVFLSILVYIATQRRKNRAQTS